MCHCDTFNRGCVLSLGFKLYICFNDSATSTLICSPERNIELAVFKPIVTSLKLFKLDEKETY